MSRKQRSIRLGIWTMAIAFSVTSLVVMGMTPESQSIPMVPILVSIPFGFLVGRLVAAVLYRIEFAPSRPRMESGFNSFESRQREAA
jgi:hypothetical protein